MDPIQEFAVELPLLRISILRTLWTFRHILHETARELLEAEMKDRAKELTRNQR